MHDACLSPLMALAEIYCAEDFKWEVGKRQNRIFTAKRRKSDFKSSDWYTKAASSISAIKASNSDARETRPANIENS